MESAPDGWTFLQFVTSVRCTRAGIIMSLALGLSRSSVSSRSPLHTTAEVMTRCLAVDIVVPVV